MYEQSGIKPKNRCKRKRIWLRKWELSGNNEFLTEEIRRNPNISFETAFLDFVTYVCVFLFKFHSMDNMSKMLDVVTKNTLLVYYRLLF